MRLVLRHILWLITANFGYADRYVEALETRLSKVEGLLKEVHVYA